MKSTTDSDMAKNVLSLCLLVIVSYLLLLLLAVGLKMDYPTIQQATAQIVTEHAECSDQLEVEEVTIVYGFTGPLLSPITVFFLKCQEAGISIRIQNPSDQ